ncbi:mitogen-activated protein kinase kinase kinase 5-like [Dysidea avara]|uniref:mitogen-activated protein kinase kinase kinase 5-like n=1 Tax=Dysidea avara TaxID=196820 RepID=UPI003317DCB7
MAWIHSTSGLASPSAHPLVKAILGGLQRTLAKPVVKKEPLTIEMVEAMLADADQPGSLSDMRLGTACLLGYAAFLRFSELVELRPCDFSIVGDVMTIHILRKRFSLIFELKQLRGMIDEDPHLFTAEIILNLLLSYRDIQDYESMIELVDKLPNHEQMQKPPIQMWYAFALNRCNNPGDKDHALSVMEEQLKHQENHVSDVLCLCGRIYKDKFVESDYIDNECRDKAIHWNDPEHSDWS